MSHLTDCAAISAIASIAVGAVGFLMDIAFDAVAFCKWCIRTCAAGLLLSMALGGLAWLLAACSPPSPWPSVTNACRDHGGPHISTVVAKDKVFVECRDGTRFVVIER